MVSGITPPSTRASVMVPPGASPPSRCVTPGSLPFRPAHTRPGQSHASRPVTCQGASTAPARTGLATPDDSPTHFPRGKHWQVHKFGGTCLATPERIDAVCRYLTSPEAAGERRLAVLSAMGSHPSSPVKVTDLLLAMVAKAGRRDESYLLELAALQQKHVAAAATLLGADSPALVEFVAGLEADMADLRSILHTLAIAGMSAEPFEDYVAGHGELWCGRLAAARCRQLCADAVFLDARDVLTVRDTADGASVDVEYDASDARLDAWAAAHGAPPLLLATGFVARNPAGQATTLKRNGSDYSATIFGALLRAGAITIWSDVNGVYSADPRKVPEAVCLRHLSYHEAWEMSYFGANVLHPRTTLPAMKFGIPITSRNFFDLSEAGTMISDGSIPQAEGVDLTGVKGFATIDGVSLVNVEGTGMVGVPGTASAIFATMRDAGVNVIMISQASSEHSICFAVKAADSVRAVDALRARFQEAIAAGRISCVAALDDCCVLAAVGSAMASRRGVAATMFAALAQANINVRAIAQGCSEYNITALIDARESAAKLRDEYHLDIRVLAIASSKRMLLSDDAIDLAAWRGELEARGEPLDEERFAAHLSDNFIPNVVALDCTAAEGPSERYLEWMRRGIHIITPNKKMNSGSLERAFCCLPVIATLQHLVQSGDRVQRIEGIFSGTLSYIFNTFGTDDRPFSEVVKEAKAAGYTEPDPRDDLAGTDVARKVTILGREAGLPLELDDVAVESLVPAPLRSLPTAADFLARLPEHDAEMDAALQAARAAGECLRFVGVVDVAGREGRVELRRYPTSHPFAQLSGQASMPVRLAFRGAPLNLAPKAAPHRPRAVRARRVAPRAEATQVGSTYANALIEAAQAENSLEDVHSDVDALAGLLRENKDIAEFLSNPTIRVEAKKELLKRVGGEVGFKDYTLNFLNLILDRNRMDSLDDIVEAFETEYCKLTDTQLATVRSAVKLEQEQQFLIAKKLQELTGSKNIKLKPVVDESLIGGFIVEYGSSQMDHSVRGQLDQITSGMKSAAEKL
ncbi:Bifunctional aspartokinase/homoserine dehydrogenase, chloroplastic [Auxenochlorella protothecoides]|uniref:Bifunctional aspartokinase/homoserine dehydrogenase, chloroplastic n=1 Tax=Auxenochlorella protothecoides TaxID=3075 RepID=A0A087SRW2_AUXPR|nr:Bifunctional aspartokinase/homoserine dehydrogenase, chloroplastic [Auxenochlorella protothecoides]KFM28466.1 Bifunctional aspartokinase/homoserine dehydrogenase, chloroplastic [Auxenochlorella protothecoides]